MTLSYITDGIPISRCPRTRRILNESIVTLTANTINGPRTIECRDGFQRTKLWYMGLNRAKKVWVNGVSTQKF